MSRETNIGNEVVLLEDLSCNGTFVNKKQVGRGKKVVLQNNDEISLAHANKKGAFIYLSICIFINYMCLEGGVIELGEKKEGDESCLADQ